jgi:hypothetical protein
MSEQRWTLAQLRGDKPVVWAGPQIPAGVGPIEVCPVSELEAARGSAEADDHAAQRWMVTAEDLEVQLAECARIAGVEVVDTPRGAARAVEAVKDLRRDYDELAAEMERVRKLAWARCGLEEPEHG